ncbi:hypothetical protein ACQE32_11195 [Pantoea sp. FN0302]|uniref:hypothetical protein n=1 Tax=Pantoea sp. FN0302 TaxID=3418558 RepID=UPI003CE834FD
MSVTYRLTAAGHHVGSRNDIASAVGKQHHAAADGITSAADNIASTADQQHHGRLSGLAKSQSQSQKKL